MKKFIFVVHNHQPVGNFDSVFENAFNKAYLPFIEVASKFDKFKFGVHYSGPLLRWLSKNKSEFLSIIKNLVSEGRVEILGGSFAESILPIWDEDSSKAQIERMSDLVFDLFGVKPYGIWLAERAWEPNLPSIINPLEYVVVDDIHLKRCGVYSKELVQNVFVADNLFSKIKLLPSNEVLRYTIPFRQPKETIDYINSFDDNSFFVFADDGEKFGIWPGTYDWVYKQNWLENFLNEMVNVVEFVLPKDFFETFQGVVKRANPPTGSYTELGEWALGFEAQKEYNDYINQIESINLYDSKKHFIQGGTWRNFLAKYDEANNMHKRVLFAKQFLDKSNEHKMQQFFDSQCNDAYWHGIFGGLYMPHLRNAVYENIIASSQWSEPIVSADIDNDFSIEYILSNDLFNVFVKPNYSGSIFEFDIKPFNFNIANTIRRHREFYHTKIDYKTQSSGVESIHNQLIAKEKGIENSIFYDKNNRYSFVDHLVEKDLTLTEVFESSFKEVNDIPKYSSKAFDYSLHLENHQYDIKKVYTINNSSLIVDIYQSNNHYNLYEELNFTFLSAFFDKQIIINEKEHNMDAFIEEQTDNILLADNYRKLYFNLNFTPSHVLIVPVYSVSLSENGVEKLYQQTCIFIKCDAPMFSLRFNLL